MDIVDQLTAPEKHDCIDLCSISDVCMGIWTFILIEILVTLKHAVTSGHFCNVSDLTYWLIWLILVHNWLYTVHNEYTISK